jgi:hypothetical protein
MNSLSPNAPFRDGAEGFEMTRGMIYKLYYYRPPAYWKNSAMAGAVAELPG